MKTTYLPQRHPDFIPVIRTMLESAFDWERTDEGMEYWLEVWEALERIAQKGQ